MIVLRLTFVLHFVIVLHMDKVHEQVKLSSKYQVVIPKTARNIMGLTKKSGYTLRVKKVTSTEITLEKVPDWRDYIGSYKNECVGPVNSVRQQRDTEWE